MSDSILTSTKKVLGIEENYTAFDPDIIMHINSALTVLHDLGVGPEDALAITDHAASWGDLDAPDNQLGTIKTYLYLKVRLGFDPPATSFHIEALNKQIEEHEYRLKERREALIPIPEPVVEEVYVEW